MDAPPSFEQLRSLLDEAADGALTDYPKILHLSVKVVAAGSPVVVSMLFDLTDPPPAE